MRVAILGSRAWTDVEQVQHFVQELARLDARTVLVLDGAAGVGIVAEREAKLHGLVIEVHPPDWKKHGRAAGPIRRREMIAAADKVVIFWDGVTKDTYSSISHARSLGKRLTIVMPYGKAEEGLQ